MAVTEAEAGVTRLLAEGQQGPLEATGSRDRPGPDPHRGLWEEAALPSPALWAFLLSESHPVICYWP